MPVGKNLEDLTFLSEEIVRFRSELSGGLKALVANHRAELLYGFNHKDFGFVMIGRAASKRLDEMADRVLTSAGFEDIVSPAIVRETIIHFFCADIIDKKLELTQSRADKIASKTILHIRSNKLRSITHFFPCHLPDDNQSEEFQIGEIRFTKTSKLLAEKSEALNLYSENTRKYWASLAPASPNSSVDSLHSSDKRETLEVDLRKYFALFDWVAIVKVSEVEATRSAKIAKLQLVTALNIIKLFFPPEHGRKVSADFSTRSREEFVSLTEENCELEITFHRRWNRSRHNGWVSKIIYGEGADWVATAGSLIDFLFRQSKLPLLYQRYLNALWWYGESLSQEEVPFLRVLSLTNSLEAILNTIEGKNDSRSISDEVAIRTSLLLDIPNEKIDWKKLTKKLYDIRSDLTHGRTPAFEESLTAEINQGTRIVHRVLMETLSWTLFLAINGAPKTLSEIDKRFEEDLERFCKGEFSNAPLTS